LLPGNTHSYRLFWVSRRTVTRARRTVTRAPAAPLPARPARPPPGAIGEDGIMTLAFELTEQIERHLVSDQIAWLTTVTPSGRPAPKPVWFVWDGSVITIYSVNDGAKLRHIEVNDNVSIHFNSNAGGGDIVVISGRAHRVPDAPPPSQFPGLLDKYMPAIMAMSREPRWFDENYGMALRVVPERAWTIA
jgi:PPOX class probable F420-dependent enzyme